MENKLKNFLLKYAVILSLILLLTISSFCCLLNNNKVVFAQDTYATFLKTWQTEISTQTESVVSSGNIGSLTITKDSTDLLDNPNFTVEIGADDTGDSMGDTYGSLLAYFKVNGNLYDCVIYSACDYIYAPANSSSLFGGLSACKTINIKSLNTTKCTNMGGMFSGCYLVKNLDLTCFETTNLLTIDNMFSDCASLKILDLSSFDLSNMQNCFGVMTNTKIGYIKCPSAIRSTGFTIALSQGITYTLNHQSSGNTIMMSSNTAGGILQATCYLYIKYVDSTYNQSFPYLYGDTILYASIPLETNITGYETDKIYYDEACTQVVDQDFQIMGEFLTTDNVFKQVLYVNTIPKSYTVSIDANGGEFSTTETTIDAKYGTDMPTLKSEQIPTLPQSIKVFTGFFANNDGTGTQYYNSDGTSASVWDVDTTSDIKIYAFYDYLSYDISFSSNGGYFGAAQDQITNQTKSVKFNSPMPTLDSAFLPTKTGYTFGGYYLSTDDQQTLYYGSDLAALKTESDLVAGQVLKAKWTALVFKITFDFGKGANTDTGTKIIYQKYGDGFYLDESCETTKLISIELPVLNLATFTGYYFGDEELCSIDEDGTILMSSTKFLQDQTMTAGWTKQMFKISFDTNGSYTVIDSVRVPFGDSFDLSTLKTPNKFCCALAGWSTSKSASDMVDQDFEMPTNDVTLYAIYKVDIAYVIIVALSGVLLLAVLVSIISVVKKKSRKQRIVRVIPNALFKTTEQLSDQNAENKDIIIKSRNGRK